MSKPNLLEEAIKLLGSEAKLAEAAGFSQVAINKAKRRVASGHHVTAELAVGIERATGGQIPRWRLRPDLWSPPIEGRAA